MKRFLLSAIFASVALTGGIWLAATATAVPQPVGAPVVDEVPLDAATTTTGEDIVPKATAGIHMTESSGFLTRNGLRGLALTVVPLPQFPAFDAIIVRESGWNIFAINPASGAYGLGQALPAFKMGTHGWDWAFNPLTQIRWTYDYMVARYGGPDQAWAFWQRNHWY